MSKLAATVVVVESSFFLTLFKKKEEDESRTTNRPTDGDEKEKERRRQQRSNRRREFILFSLSLSFFLHITTFFLRHSLTLGFFGSCVRHPTTASGFHPHENRKEKRGNNVVTTSMFIDTLAFLLTRKLVGKHKKKKERQSSFINNQGKIVTKTDTPFLFIFFRVLASFFFPLFLITSLMMML